MKTLIALLLLLAGTASAADQPAQPVDPLALAALMLSDHHPDRALQVLQAEETLQQLQQDKMDAVRYYTLLGLAHKAQQQWQPAWDALQQAVQLGADNPSLHVHLARIAWALKRYPDVIQQVDQAGPMLLQLPALHLLKARSQWQLKQKQAAWKTIDTALQHFPDEAMLLRQQIDMLLQEKLYQQAAQRGLELINRGLGKQDDWLAIGNALRVSHAYDQALELLEQARLRNPRDKRLTRLLARTWLESGHANAAADLLYQTWMLLGAQNQELLTETTELYRRAGRLHQALDLSERIEDERVKLRQRLAIYLQLGEFDKLLNSEEALLRLQLLGDENIRYTLAYAAFRQGDFKTMEKHLQTIRNGALFRKAAALRKAASECADKVWQCAG